MDLPRDSSDIQIVTACQACTGNGGHGLRAACNGGNAFQTCTTCNGTGWTLKRPADITAAELAKLIKRLPQLDHLPDAPPGSVKPPIRQLGP